MTQKNKENKIGLQRLYSPCGLGDGAGGGAGVASQGHLEGVGGVRTGVLRGGGASESPAKYYSIYEQK